RALYRGRVRHSAEYEAHVELLTHAIAETAQGRSASLGTFPSYAPARVILDQLRVRFLRIVSASTEQHALPEVVTMLQSIDQVQLLVDGDAAQRFASRLSGANALELVVEVAHDMRSPLTSVLFLADALYRGHSGSLTPHQQRQLLIIYGAAFGLSALVSDLIDLARGGDRLIERTAVPFSLRECLNSVRDIVQPIAEERRLTLEFSTPDTDYRLGRPAAIARVVLNLITNALRYTETGSVRAVARELGRDRVEFQVSDTGCGIPPDIAGSLFETFRRRGDTHGFVLSSEGLGLSVCSKLIAAMEGELRMQTEPGNGTTFTFELHLPPAPRV
ncbi:MAG TPA: HAMP domain-containing sensor histidine kinase, partial [Gemmatimonadaceae bacterium]|nr:HAMP domain-containing sensor histidine kinase [Gemmatimonadaceae bacterium]